MRLSVMPHQLMMMRMMAHLMENWLVWIKKMMMRVTVNSKMASPLQAKEQSVSSHLINQNAI